MADAAGVSGTEIPARVVLSELSVEALETMPWLDAALAPEWALGDLQAAVSNGHGLLVCDSDGVAIGAAVVLRDVPEPGCATVPFLGIDPERRFRGLGGEAGLQIVEDLRREGVTRVFAPVPDGRGLAVYFWLRLGFRPLTTPESPGDLIGLSAQPVRGIWMLREEQ